jgi:AcrR family transcriptional regulator
MLAESASVSRVHEFQRARLLAAAVRAIDELGYANTTVTDVTARARVSRRTFYELFVDRDECLGAAIGEVVERLAGELASLDTAGLAWRERVRAGLWAILSFFDREPLLARVCVVQAASGGPEVSKRRARAMVELADAIDEGRREAARGCDCSRVTAEGLVGAALAIVYARVARRERKPLVSLTGELMALIVLPYLGSAAARRERARSGAPRDRTARGRSPRGGRAAATLAGGDPLEGVTMRLTYRTARVLTSVAGCPGASNRVVAQQAGIADAGQVSKLLARLERLGLLANASGGHTRGEPNAWSLTPKGERVAQRVGEHVGREEAAA